MIVLGLTGSIGMGKSTAMAMLKELGVPGHDSDQAVHELLKPGAAGYNAVSTTFPYSDYAEIYEAENGPINREALGKIIFHDADKRKVLEGILHPLVRESQGDFIREQAQMGAEIVVLDIPLLFETGADDFVDYTLVVHAPADVQEERVLKRPGMTPEKFQAIKAAQMPSEEKCRRADFVVQSGTDHASMLNELKDVLRRLKTFGDKIEKSDE